MPLRIVFMGTPDFAVPTLAGIVGQGHDLAAVFTRAPAKAGRGMALKPSPVHAMAESFGVPVFTPQSLRGEEAAEQFRSLNADAAVVVAYGLLLPKAVLDAPREGCLNLHASLLPRWRGAAPIHRAVIAGDGETGVMVMRMEEGLDTGPVALVDRVAIDADETTGQLHDRLKILGADLMLRALAALERGSLSFTPQGEHGVAYAKKITNDEARIDWRRPAAETHNLIRGLSPFPGAFFEADLGRGVERVKALRSRLADGGGRPGEIIDDELTIACGDGAVRLIEIQRAGSKPMPAREFLRGAKLAAGTLL
ncbi:MAG: methionyl-tRNA formyltransferase [Rhizobiales bacterium]|nr:methionyl-tRNA formyltransferase [Hyphomicrobiales bacterium]